MKNDKFLISFFIVVIFTVAGCVANGPLLKPSQDSRREYVNTHPQLSQEIKQAILEGKVIKGMTKEDVKASWGEPTDIDDLSKDPNAWWFQEDAEWWAYRSFSLSFASKRYVKFKKGIVVDIQIIHWYEG